MAYHALPAGMLSVSPSAHIVDLGLNLGSSFVCLTGRVRTTEHLFSSNHEPFEATSQDSLKRLVPHVRNLNS